LLKNLKNDLRIHSGCNCGSVSRKRHDKHSERVWWSHQFGPRSNAGNQLWNAEIRDREARVVNSAVDRTRGFKTFYGKTTSQSLPRRAEKHGGAIAGSSAIRGRVFSNHGGVEAAARSQRQGRNCQETRQETTSPRSVRVDKRKWNRADYCGSDYCVSHSVVSMNENAVIGFSISGNYPK